MSVTPTITRFCHQSWQLTSSIQLVKQGENALYVITEVTPFHPVSHIWPDHPADKGRIEGYEVKDCVVGAVELSSGELYVDKDIPVKRDTQGWVFVVVHCLEEPAINLRLGQEVTLVVDKAYQQALSRGHSAGHIAFLALNKVLVAHGYWRKDADRKDPHGNYDFNSYAQETSYVSEDQCVDTYRLGKTLRKRGLNSADVVKDLVQIQVLVNQQIEQWLSLEAKISIKCCGESLTDSRYWQCDLGEGSVAEIPCGGTHAKSLNEYKAIRVSFTQLDTQNIEMRTNVIAA
ncbi:alanyl-tRNA editing protein [Vibrio sp. Isolate23]|uniref:alanyl-tRNA editing protein n=1 Tax=Vibrio sp. Isolate23 TaxID=2908533 RepID=UPI001EFD2E49|nr:alanyl-tRNA editing protein [Vibrio sp. Isolate23]MCG9683415.1 alanyl-tRNA editing protein [Vibrio sp. Isolate23]